MNHKKPSLGAHVSIAGGLKKAFDRATLLNASTMQIFTKSNRQWSAKPLKKEEVAAFKDAAKKTGITPLVAHSSYLINIGSPNKDLQEKSSQALALELQRCIDLGIDYLVLHPGSHGTGTIKECEKAIAEQINIIYKAIPGTTMILLENTAGQGTNIGFTFEQLKAICDQIENKNRIGICFDTCHAFAAGYDFRDPDSYKKLWKAFDDTIGLEKLKAIHLNDSKKSLGSRVDRHEHIGKGCIGLEGFRLLMNDKRLQSIPKILETPKEGGPDENEDYENNMRQVINLIK